MKKKWFFAGAVLLMAAAAVTVHLTREQSVSFDLLSANVEALTNGEILNGKICHYYGTEIYGDYIPCKAQYPNIGPCGEREHTFYSNNTGQWYVM